MMLNAENAAFCRAVPAAGATSATQALRDSGYHIVHGLLPRSVIEELNRQLDETFKKTPPSQGLFYGNWTRRFGGLLKRSPIAEALTLQPDILRLVEHFLNPHCDRIQLSLMQAIELAPGGPAQVPHRDQESWGGEKGKFEYIVSVMWPLTPFTADNGATIVWPGSNHADLDLESVFTRGVPAIMEPGDALIFLGSTMHASGANFSALPRRGLIVSYCLGWLKPHENQWLVYPPEVAKTFSPELAALVGYCRHRPNLNNYEGQCPSILLRDKLPDFIPAVDEFPEALNVQIDGFRRAERARSQATNSIQ